MTRLGRCLIVATALLLASGSARAGDVTVTMSDGKITVVATNATLREILLEWTRVGGTTFVNVDRIVSPPITLELHDAAEWDALSVLLRSLDGYVATERTRAERGRSTFDRIVLVTASAAPSAAAPGPVASSTAPEIPAPVFVETPRPRFTATPGVRPVMPAPGGGWQLADAPAEVTSVAATGASGSPPAVATGSRVPTGAAGSAVPGVVVPAPTKNEPAQIQPSMPAKPLYSTHDDDQPNQPVQQPQR